MRFKLFEEFLNEGINDPGILKVFFMAGGPGSGKSYVATELFDFPKGAMSSVSYATGLKLVNNDNAFERELKNAGLDPGKLADYAADEDMWDNIVMPLRNKAKGITKRMQDNYIGGRLGQVVDGTGKDFDKIAGLRKLYQDLGYDTYMVFVNTSKEVALERNQNRERKLADKMVAKMWKQVQDNLGKFQKLFGANNMLIVDNSSYDNQNILDQIEKAVMSRIKAPVKNPIGKKWMHENSPQNRNRNQPYGVRPGVRESLQEAKFTDYDNNELAAYVKNNPKDKEAAKELSKRSKKLRDLSRTDESVINEAKGDQITIHWAGLKTGKEGTIGTFIVSPKVHAQLEDEFGSEISIDFYDENVRGKLSSYDDIVDAMRNSKYGKIAMVGAVDESVINEAASISAKMPASMKKWIMGEVKSNPDTWSNELTDLTNEIVSIYREMDLDLDKSEAGPEWVNVRELPVSELTTRCVEKINEIWPQMSEWAKEYIYADYSHWFKVTKKDRPHYGETE